MILPRMRTYVRFMLMIRFARFHCLGQLSSMLFVHGSVKRCWFRVALVVHLGAELGQLPYMRKDSLIFNPLLEKLVSTNFWRAMFEPRPSGCVIIYFTSFLTACWDCSTFLAYLNA